MIFSILRNLTKNLIAIKKKTSRGNNSVKSTFLTRHSDLSVGSRSSDHFPHELPPTRGGREREQEEYKFNLRSQEMK